MKERNLDVRFCRINIVSTIKDKKYGHAQHEVEPGLYVLTHSSTKDKKKMLEKINIPAPWHSRSYQKNWCVTLKEQRMPQAGLWLQQSFHLHLRAWLKAR